MRELTVNRITLPFKNNNIEVVSAINEGNNRFKFTTDTPHGLTPSSRVTLKKEFSPAVAAQRLQNRKYTIPTQREFPVEIISPKEFYIDFNNYILVNVVNYDINKTGALLEFIGIKPYECVNDINNIEVKSMGVTYNGGIGLIYDRFAEQETGSMYTNEEDLSATLVTFTTPMPYIIDNGSVYVKHTWHLKDDGVTFDDVNIKIYESSVFSGSFISLSQDTCYKVGDDKLVGEKFLNEVLESIVPEIVDNEKRQFLPAMAKGSTFKLAQELEFNLHFRSRIDLDKSTDDEIVLSDTFKTTDEQIWNGFRWANNIAESTLERENNKYSDDFADELNHLGFTEDDIKYQKTKLKKSFIRLMFYSSKNMLEQELLYYSTIFLDTGELYAKYSNIKNSSDKNAFNPNRTDESLRLSARFSVKNKYDGKKSSEGFYLYLFPNEVKGGENTPTTIYMKVEFNHAGYGKTVPMMMPREIYNKVNNEYDTSKVVYNDSNNVLSSTSQFFPTSFLVNEKIGVDNDGEDIEGIKMDIDRYNDSIMIPINIIYDKTLKSYLYYFPWYTRANENKIVINLWEPRIRGGINGTN